MVKKGKIVALAKDSSAARNGLLVHHYICEVNGQNVIGMKVGAVHSRGCSGWGQGSYEGLLGGWGELDPPQTSLLSPTG